MILVDKKGTVLFETPVSAVIDGEDGMGQLIGHKAMEMAIEKAKTTGIGMITVRNSNHYGIAGYYAKLACDAGLIGISCTNTNPIMVPTYGRTAMLGTTSDRTGMNGKGGICHGFVAIDPAIFGDAEGIRAHLSAYLQALREAPKAEGQDRIYTHGEKEIEVKEDMLKNGIPVNENTMVEVMEMCQYLDMDFAAYFGDYKSRATPDLRGISIEKRE